MKVDFEYAIIDLDIPVYKSAASAQKTWYDLYDGDGELVESFPGAKQCKDHLEELEHFLGVDTSEYKRESRVVVGEYEDAVKTLDGMVEHYLKLSNAKQGWFSIGGGGNFRDDLAKIQKYKGERTNEKPHHFKALREYAIKKYRPQIADGVESDDLISMRLYKDYLLGRKTKNKNLCKCVMIDLEKDCRTTPGWHLDPLKDKEPVWISTLEANRWCMTMAIGGDQADCYAGCVGYGYKKAAKVLADCKTNKEMWEKTKQTFKDVYGEGVVVKKSWNGEQIDMTAEDMLEENARLAFMLREGDIEEDWKVLKGEEFD